MMKMVSPSTPKTPNQARSSRSRTPSRVATPQVNKTKVSRKKKSSRARTPTRWVASTPNSQINKSTTKGSNKTPKSSTKSSSKKRKSIPIEDDPKEKKSKKLKTPNKSKSEKKSSSARARLPELDDLEVDLSLNRSDSPIRRSKRSRQFLNPIKEEDLSYRLQTTSSPVNGSFTDRPSSPNNTSTSDKWSWFSCTIM